LNSPDPLHDQLVLGRRKLRAILSSAPPRVVGVGELLTTASSRGEIYRLRAGWACRFHDLADGRRAILDVYLPGDVIVLGTRPAGEVLTLTAATIEAISAEDSLELMADRFTALYIAFLLSQRLRHTDRLVTAISCLDARGRLAMALLDFYTRLRRRKLILGTSYNLPLTQMQVGNYLGLTVVHVNRVLRSLRGERIVDLEKHHVTILDLERLTSLAHCGEIVSSATRSSTEVALLADKAAE
jgi:CRP/FNR family transcriptional regulator, anaerobic regulatory protein